MKFMKKIRLSAVALSLLALAGGLASCGETTVEEGYEYALVTDVGDIDDESFNQTSWEALRDFAEDNKKTYAYYRPTEDSTAARLISIDQAVARGAKVVVCPGYLFEDAVYEAQTTYPEVKFVLLDGAPHTADYSTYHTAENTVSIIYQEEIAGFLAGYAAVKDGNRALGFCGGMAVPAVQRFGSGFVQGADVALKELGETGTLRYYYAGAFAATDAATALMKTWYTDGMDTVFACGGKVYQSVQEACNSASDATWIGVDVDQSSVDPKVLTSATKGLYESVQSSLEIYANDKWSEIGGQDFNLGLDSTFASIAAKDYVGLPTNADAWRFEKFSTAEYEALLNGIKDGTYTISNSITEAPTVSSSLTVTWESAFAGA